MTTAPRFKDRKKIFGIDSTRPQQRAIAEGKIRFRALTHGHYPGTLIPKNLLPGLNSIGFLDARGDQDWGLEPHRNEGIEIVLLETGNMVFTLGTHRHKLKAGSLTITRPWQLHCLGDPNLGPGRLHWVLIDVGIRRPHQPWKWPRWVMLTTEEKQELTRKLSLNEHPVWNSTPAITQDFKELAACIETFDRKETATLLTLHMNHLLLSILAALRKQCLEQNENLKSYNRSVEMFFAELHEKPEASAKPWTLQEMARHCGMGTTTFSRCSHAIVNMSPWEYLIRCRLDRAANFLRSDARKSITEIAFDCGFNSSQYFAFQFRRRFGCSPHGYRAKHSLLN